MKQTNLSSVFSTNDDDDDDEEDEENNDSLQDSFKGKKALEQMSKKSQMRQLQLGEMAAASSLPSTSAAIAAAAAASSASLMTMSAAAATANYQRLKLFHKRLVLTEAEKQEILVQETSV